MKKLTKEENNLKVSTEFFDKLEENCIKHEELADKRSNELHFYRTLVDQGKMSISEYVKLITNQQI